VDPSTRPHSAAYFDEQRDFWWNDDFLRLVATRIGLERVRSVLDVGAGLGHWGSTLLGLLSPEASVIGVERDPRWVIQAGERVDELGLTDRYRYVQGVAEGLPFEDQSFDLATCQTLLIHVADPAAVICEMRRVVRPGGLLLLSEPNNLAGMLVADSTTAGKQVAELMERIAFALICERGKAAVGDGDSSVGDRLPGMLAEAGLIDIQCVLNDKTFALTPPYEPDDQRALRDVIIANAESDRWVWSHEEAKRYFVAGGGPANEFEPRWQRRLEESRETARELAANRLHTAGGGIHYLVSGRRPT
jgi:ubiquinone/menaquinone biosynthesis C-methylase UbiE